MTYDRIAVISKVVCAASADKILTNNLTRQCCNIIRADKLPESLYLRAGFALGKFHFSVQVQQC